MKTQTAYPGKSSGLHNYSKIKKLIVRGRFGKAEKLCDASIQKNPKDYRYWWMRFLAKTNNMKLNCKPGKNVLLDAIEAIDLAEPEISVRLKNRLDRYVWYRKNPKMHKKNRPGPPAAKEVQKSVPKKRRRFRRLIVSFTIAAALALFALTSLLHNE